MVSISHTFSEQSESVEWKSVVQNAGLFSGINLLSRTGGSAKQHSKKRTSPSSHVGIGSYAMFSQLNHFGISFVRLLYIVLH